MADFEFLTPQQVWDALKDYNQKHYRSHSAVYSGETLELAASSDTGSFWRRKGKARVHIPIAADIATTSSDLLFSEEPRFACKDKATGKEETQQQKRLDFLVKKDGIHAKLNEAAESAAALGDIYLKLNWRTGTLTHPVLAVVQADTAWPEYLLGILQGIHFFSIYKRNTDGSVVTRIYERYTPGMIAMAAFRGNAENLGVQLNEAELQAIGFEAIIVTPVPDMLAVHIPNIKPNRKDRGGVHGRSDYDGMRTLMDALDESYSSWVRDIRIGKAKTIVPLEYLRRKPQDMLDTDVVYEFDQDTETFVALDIDTEKAGAGSIKTVQPKIRADDHQKTCMDLVRQIVTGAGYSPQTFGLDIQGMAQSGTALYIREKKSFSTLGKKQTYWKSRLEEIMTAMTHLDAALYPGQGSKADDEIEVNFTANTSNDLTATSTAVEMLNRAAAVSTTIKVQMLHPEWTEKQVKEEVAAILTEQGLGLPSPLPGDGGSNEFPDKNPANPSEAKDGE